MDSKTLRVGNDEVGIVQIGSNNPLVFIGGPCAIESRDHTLYMAQEIKNICDELNIEWIFKSCYDKDCRSSKDSFHGIGKSEGLDILSMVRKNLKCQLFLISLIQVGQVILLKYVTSYKFQPIYAGKQPF